MACRETGAGGGGGSAGGVMKVDLGDRAWEALFLAVLIEFIVYARVWVWRRWVEAYL